MRTPAGHKVYAMAAEYPSAAALYEAAKRVRDAGFRRWDVYSPFPIHGMDEAMGLGKSWLSGWVLFGGVSGLLTAALVEFGPSWFLYRLNVHGKPWNFWTVPAFFPIMFELTVLFGAFASFFAMLGMNGLPRWYHPMFNWERRIDVPASETRISDVLGRFVKGGCARVLRCHCVNFVTGRSPHHMRSFPRGDID